MYTHLYTDTDNDQIWYSSTIVTAAEIFSNIVFLQKKKSLTPKHITHFEIKFLLNWLSRHTKISEISKITPYILKKNYLVHEYCNVKTVLWFILSPFKASEKKKVLFTLF